MLLVAPVEDEVVQVLEERDEVAAREPFKHVSDWGSLLISSSIVLRASWPAVMDAKTG